MGQMLRFATKRNVVIVFIIALVTLGVVASRFYVASPRDNDQPSQANAEPPSYAVQSSKLAEEKVGLSLNDPRAFQGYTLFAPLASTKTYLINMQGRVVRTWESDCTPALGAYLLENGHLLRPGTITQHQLANVPGAGGRVQEFTWYGKLVWDFRFASDKQLPHHDVCKLPNGNVLMILWEKKSAQEAVAAGRRPELAGFSFMLPDCIIEVKPTGQSTGEVVWEWHIWDHLVQDQDSSRPNYGDIAAHPELVDINYSESLIASMLATKDGLDKLRSLGYVGSAAVGKKPQSISPDWTHFNSVAYNAKLDQIMLSVHAFSEIWIVDHSTTTAQAAGHSGGRYGKGGDLLYRWGNPRAYHAGGAEDQQFFHQHDAQWIPRGVPGEGHVLVFNNGSNRPHGNYSSVDEIVLPAEQEGLYTFKPGTIYGPGRPIWSYAARDKLEFFDRLMSGAQRLPNGNTLICSSSTGKIFEVTAEKELVWKYLSPIEGKPAPALSRDGAKRGVISVFRAQRYAPDYAGLIGRNLLPGKTVEELLQEETTKK